MMSGVSTALTPSGTPGGPDPDQSIEPNAYAVAFRLLGDRPSAAAVAGIAAEQLRQSGHRSSPDWLAHLTHYTVTQAVAPGTIALPEAPDDEHAGLRAALRRRLANATPTERVAASLVHLAGYPVDFVAGVLGRTEDDTRALAGVLAPPPGVAYRVLGDPELTRVRTVQPLASGRARRWRPSWTTVVMLVVLAVLVLAATQITGPRPTLGPPISQPAGSEAPVASDSDGPTG